MARKHHPLWRPSPLDRAVSARLGPQAAFVPLDGGFGYVDEPTGIGRSPTLDLAQAVYEACPERARTVLRQRIRLGRAPGELDRAVAAVAAKRLGEVPPEDGPVEVPLIHLGGAAAAARERGRAALFEPGAERDPHQLVAELAEERIVAVLVDPGGRIRLGAWNTASENRTFHAELNLVQGWARTGGRIPEGSRIVASLQPCRMCAALMVEAALGPIRVEYLTPDPGRLATRTALQSLGWEQRIVPG